MIGELTQAMKRYTDRHPGVSVIDTGQGELAVMRSDHPKPPNPVFSRPALCIVAQGAKWATFGTNRMVYRAGEALVVGVAAPSVGRVVEASPDKPCLVLALELDLTAMRSVAEQLPPPARSVAAAGPPVCVVDMQGPLIECAVRIMRLLDRPEALAALYPMIVREICYWLLTGPQGAEVMRMGLASGPSQRVIGAIHRLRERFATPVRIAELAAIAQMSPSAFHRQFKALTALTPLQYQKQLRLLEARRLMISQAFNVEAAAFEVGYESPSQFSREYARMFGSPPKRDTTRLLVTHGSGVAAQALGPSEAAPSA